MQEKQKKVLLVEDYRDTREALELMLVLNGYAVETAENGQDALDKLAGTSTLPFCIFLDMKMPVMDGWEFLRVKARWPEIADIPVVVFTASNKPPITDASVFKVILKPVSTGELLSTADELCRNRDQSK